jgi:uncharacterized membrane protein
MALSCASCGAQVTEGATNCSACGKPAGQTAGGAEGTPPPTASAGPLADNVAGMLAYVTIIPAIFFLASGPYNKNPIIRFHSFQSIFFYVVWIGLSISLSVFGGIPVLGRLAVLIGPLVALAGLGICVFLLLKAYQGQMFKLPVIGDMAAKQASAGG